ncbi:MAG: RidA family protein [Sphingobium sp.]
MKYASLFVAALLAAPSIASAAPVRHEAPGWPILAGVTLPPESQITILSGTVPLPGKDGSYGTTRDQAVSAFRQIKAQLAEQGLTMGDVVKLTVFLVGDPKLGGKMDFKGFSEAYGQFFGTKDQPHVVARSVVQVAGLVDPGWLVEIEAIAAK